MLDTDEHGKYIFQSKIFAKIRSNEQTRISCYIWWRPNCTQLHVQLDDHGHTRTHVTSQKPATHVFFVYLLRQTTCFKWHTLVIYRFSLIQSIEIIMWARKCSAIDTTEFPIYSFYSIFGFHTHIYCDKHRNIPALASDIKSDSPHV